MCTHWQRSASEGESGGVALTPIVAKCFPGTESGRCAHAWSSEVFPKERVGALCSRLQQRNVSQGESQGVALTLVAANCFPGRESGRCGHACNIVFSREGENWGCCVQPIFFFSYLVSFSTSFCLNPLYSSFH